MNPLIEHITKNEFVKATEILQEKIGHIVSKKLLEMKKMYSAKLTEQVSVDAEGMVHTASGETLLPSVYKLRRGLVEEKHESSKHPSVQALIKKMRAGKLNPANDPAANDNIKTANQNKPMKEETEKIHDSDGKLLGTIMTISGSHAKDPTKTVKKFRAEPVNGKTLITADKASAIAHIKNK